MPSTINTAAIDTTFPVPGADNDTQGFRDNFASIVNALTTASSEITVLQANRADLTTNNNFNSNQIQNAVLRDVGWLVRDNTANIITGTTQVNYLSGSYGIYAISTANVSTFTIIGWPTNSVSWTNIKLQIRHAEAATTNLPAYVTFAPQSSKTQYVDQDLSLPISITTNTIYIFEISSPDGGNTTFVKQVGSYV